MAIDDPTGISIRQSRQELDERDYLPNTLLQYGLSATAAAVFVNIPFLANIITSLLGGAHGRFERRLLTICEQLDADIKTLGGRILDLQYFKSEEFQTLFVLTMERIHSIHAEEKLRLCAAALANAGTSEFQEDEKEQFVRTLLDLSIADLRMLKDERLGASSVVSDEEVQSSFSRLVGMGLVQDTFRSQPGFIGVTPPARRFYSRSAFGQRFLKFIEINAVGSAVAGNEAGLG